MESVLDTFGALFYDWNDQSESLTNECVKLMPAGPIIYSLSHNPPLVTAFADNFFDIPPSGLMDVGVDSVPFYPLSSIQGTNNPHLFPHTQDRVLS